MLIGHLKLLGRSCVVSPTLLPHMIWDTMVLSWASAVLFFFPQVECVQLHCGRNKTVIRLSTLKFIVLLLCPMVHSGISKCLSLPLPLFCWLFPSQRWPSQPRLLGPESSMSMLNLYTSPSLPNISLGFSAASSPINVS